MAIATGSNAGPSLLRRLILIAAGIGVAAQVAAVNLGDWAVRRQNAVSAHIMAGTSARASTFAAEARLMAGDAEGAEALARQALADAPLSADALRTFGLALESQGEAETAGAAMTLAGGLGWRDIPTQLWLADAYIRQGDFAEGLARVDAVARQGQFRAEMRPLLIGAALEPASRGDLAERLMTRPPWRAHFFDGAHVLQPDRHDAYEAFLRQFEAAGGSVTASEAEAFADNLFDHREYARAQALWRDIVAPTDAVPFDGGFDTAMARTDHGPGPFQWRFADAPGSAARLGSPPGRADERALRAASRGDLRAKIVSQEMALPPGQHMLTAELFVESGPAGGFDWMIECLPVSRPLMSRKAAAPGRGWRELSYAFAIPADGCDGQRLSLLLRGSQSGPLAYWFDNIAVR